MSSADTVSDDSGVAIITGITGQDGSYLAEFLLEKGYHVHGWMRRTSHVPTERIEHLLKHPALTLHYCDVTDAQNVFETMRKIESLEGRPPDELYNLAAQSHVQVSFVMPAYTAQVDALGTLNILNTIKELKWLDRTRFYQASTSELFGSSPPPQNESTPFHPRSPYAVAKMYAYWITVNYREAFGMFAVNGILFNHESPRRAVNFVTRKITYGIGKIIRGELECLRLGNLNARRDFGHAKDYVRAMWLMLQQDQPKDMVLGTGETHSVREFAEKAFVCAGIVIEWHGSGLNELGVDSKTKKIVVRVDPQYFRPSEVDDLQADPATAKRLLGWEPEYTFDKLVEEMVRQDLKAHTHVY